MRILLIYATVEGQTRKIAKFVAEKLSAAGHAVQTIDASAEGQFPAPSEYDAVIAAAPVHVGHFPAAFRRLLKTHATQLMTRTGAFISVSLAAQSDDRSELNDLGTMVERLGNETGWWPVEIHHAAGALKYTEYDFFKRWIMKRIAAQEGGPVDTAHDYEFTDWTALETFLVQFTADVPELVGKI